MTTPDHNKFANAVLYLLHGCQGHPGLTKLLKLLYHADFNHYKKYLRPITGFAYVALERGPAPDDYANHLQRLVDAGVLEKRTVPVKDANAKIEFLPKSAPNLHVLSESEQEILDEVLGLHGRKTGKMLSDLTHLEGPWGYAWDPEEPGREIPFAAARWLDNICDEDDLTQAQEALGRSDIAPLVKQLEAR